LFVEFFGEDGWTKRFVLGPEYKDNIGRLTVDQENRIYFLVSVDYVPQPWSHFLLY
ncbi:MAG: hypothetical protein GWN13_27940, partial [Phycisphaerae bacterium]|nr:hypothetical protein [Phycisphaerae bacterium]